MTIQEKRSITFNQTKSNHLEQPMFFGEGVNVSRYDQIKFPWIDKHTDKQLSFFWRPEEVDLSSDRGEYSNLPENEKHIFISNLKYQTLLDSVQGRSPNLAFLPLVSLPELETWVETWSFSETIHSRSYTHIIRNIVSDPGAVFDSILENDEIIKRAESVTKDYDELIELSCERTLAMRNGTPWASDKQMKIEDALFRTMVSVNVLEGVRFYISFACSFAFAERSLMEGNAKVIKLIARDETLHLSVTQQIIQSWINNRDSEAMHLAAQRNFSFIEECFTDAVEQEKAWADYLFKDGSMIGLNATILHSYIEYIANVRCKALGVTLNDSKTNPLPWMNNWLVSDNVQVAPQESEISNYLTGQVDSSVSKDDFCGFDL